MPGSPNLREICLYEEKGKWYDSRGFNFESNGILADYLRGVNGYEKHARGKSRGLL